MTPRERFLAAAHHSTPDCVPFDLCATSLTGMAPGCQARLKELLGFSGPGKILHAGVDERILLWAGTDFRAFGGIVDLPSVHTRWISETCFVDCWGVERTLRGAYWDITRSPLKGATVQDLKDFAWPEPRVDERWLEACATRARQLQQEGRYVLIGEHPVFGLLELGCWMAGYEDFLMRMVGDLDFTKAFLDRAFDIQMKVVEATYSALGPFMDLTMSGDDFGMQTGPLLSPKVFREIIAPYFSARISRTKALAHCLYWHHSCGSIADLIDDLIAAGVDCINPVQTSARDMEPASLKARFGDRVVFWGGVDVQQFLPHASQEEVRRTVLNLIETLGQDGGYVMAPGHNIQDDVPPENIAVWIETARSAHSKTRIVKDLELRGAVT